MWVHGQRLGLVYVPTALLGHTATPGRLAISQRVWHVPMEHIPIGQQPAPTPAASGARQGHTHYQGGLHARCVLIKRSVQHIPLSVWYSLSMLLFF